MDGWTDGCMYARVGAWVRVLVDGLVVGRVWVRLGVWVGMWMGVR